MPWTAEVLTLCLGNARRFVDHTYAFAFRLLSDIQFAFLTRRDECRFAHKLVGSTACQFQLFPHQLRASEADSKISDSKHRTSLG